MKHNVHLYVVAIIKVEDVEAENDQEAVTKALVNVEPRLHEILGTPPTNGESMSYGDDILGALIDHEGDEEYNRTRYMQIATDRGVDAYKDIVKLKESPK